MLTGTSYDLTGVAATIGDASSPFAGHFAGSGDQRVVYEVTGEAGKSGLFHTAAGTEARPAVIRDLAIEVSLRGDASATDYTGALLSHADFTELSGIDAAVSYENGWKAAGIAGTVGAAASVTNCSVTARGVAQGGTTLDEFGGIAGVNSGVITDCSFVLDEGRYLVDAFGGVAYSSIGTVERCRVSMGAAEVTGLSTGEGWYIGGIAGISAGTIADCSVAAGFTKTNPTVVVGGIAGQMNAGAISGCTVTGKIAARWHAGGLVGLLMGGKRIADCSVDAQVTAGDDVAGGLIGRLCVHGSVTVTGCTASGTVSGRSDVGGLVGSIYYETDGTPDLPNAFTMEDCASYVSTVTSTQIGERAAAASGGSAGNASAGGAIGRVLGEFAYCSTTVKNCAAYSDVIAASSAAGGFVGYHTAREMAKSGSDYNYDNCVSYGSVTTSDGCGVPGYANQENAAIGGFIGSFINAVEHLRIGNCSAYGSVAITSEDNYGRNHVGGFVGYCYGTDNDVADVLVENCTASGSVYGAGGVGGFAGRFDRVTVKNCQSVGDVLLLNGWSAGGFSGVLFGTNVSGCVSRGSVRDAVPASVTAGHAIGGFAGDVGPLGDTTFDRCTSYGSVYGKQGIGGFLGYLRGSAASDIFSFTKCVAYGDALDYSTFNAATGLYENGLAKGRGYGGFIGSIPDLPGSVSFSGCTAYGDAIGYSAGGFVGYSLVRGNQGYSSCNAYGNAFDAHSDGEAGGFSGWMRGQSNVGTATVNNCHAYGNSYSMQDTGGFSGPTSTVVTATNCGWHGASLTGLNGVAAEFVVLYGDGQSTPNGSTFTNCYYETATHPGVWGFSQCWGGAAADTMRIDAATCKQGVLANANYTAEPKGRITVANDAGNIRLTMNGFTNIPAGTSISGITISTDGGKTFTELVYADKTLVRMTSGGALVECGTKITVDQNLDLTYTYELPKTVSAYPAGSIRVMLVLTNGFTVVATG